MPKLLLWRRSIHRTPHVNPRLSSHLPSSPFALFSRLLTHSRPAAEHQEDIHDPPFSPQKKHKSEIIRKKKQPPKVKATKISSDGVNEFQVKSELPFDFMYSYSEISPGVEPIGFREPRRFSPFGPDRLDRKWTGTTAPAHLNQDLEKLVEERERVLGEPLSEEETAELVEKYRHSNFSRQVNLGKGGVTHNTLEGIHNHWNRAEAVRIKCLGVPTLDMDNICFHLECAHRTKLGGRLYTVT